MGIPLWKNFTVTSLLIPSNENGVKRTDSIGKLLTLTELKSQKRIFLILYEEISDKIKEIHSVCDVINITHIMWKKWVHFLKPSFDESGKIGRLQK